VRNVVLVLFCLGDLALTGCPREERGPRTPRPAVRAPVAAKKLATARRTPKLDYPDTVKRLEVVPGPAKPGGRLDARGELVVVDALGNVFWGRLPSRPKRIGNIEPHRGSISRVGSAQAYWSPDGRRILLYADIETSDYWFLWDRRRLRGLDAGIRAIQGRVSSAPAWLAGNRLALGALPAFHGQEHLLGAGNLGSITVASAYPWRKLMTMPGPSGAERTGVWVSPDHSYLVMAGWEEKGRTQARFEVRDARGRRLGSFSQSLHDRQPVVWRADNPDEFIVRAGPYRFARYDKRGRRLASWEFQNVGHLEGVPPETWPSPDAKRMVATKGEGLLLILGKNRSLPIVPEGVRAKNCLWSPQGDLVGFVGGAQVTDKQAYIYRVGKHQVVAIDPRWSFRILGYTNAAWSPDGKWLAARAARGEGRESLIVVDRGLTQALALTPEPSSAAERIWIEVHGWSADGRHIVYLARRRSGKRETQELYVIRVDGGGQRKLLDLSDVTHVSLRDPPA